AGELRREWAFARQGPVSAERAHAISGLRRGAGLKSMASASAWLGPQRAAAIDHRDAACLGFDDETFGDSVAGEGDHVARGHRQHLLVALEPGAGAQPAIETEGQLLHFVAFGPRGGKPVGALAVAAVDEK